MPLLSLNDSLRARRSCRRIQEISDDHLRCHPRPRSRNPIRIFVPDQDDSNKNSSLNHTNNNVDNGVHNIKSFLCKEEDLESRMEGIRSYLPIGAPTSHFHIEFESTRAFGNCHLQTFLKLYGDQITQLQVYRQRLPITEKEIEFYENLPNLKCLSVVQKETRNSIGAVCDPKLHLPRVFTKLKELNVDKDCPGFSVWELLDFCTNIRSFSYMNIIEDVKELKRLLSVLDKHQHKRLEFLDLNHVALDQFELSIPERRHLTSLLIALMTKLDLKLLNVAPRIFDVMDQNQRNQFAPRIFSLGSLDITDPLLGKIRSVELFPKVRTAALSMEFNNPDVDKSETCTIIASILSVFSCKNMPSLRILSIRIRDSDFGDDVSLLLPGVWGNFPNLEELYFQRAPLIEDIMFIGKNGELPFLQLTSKAAIFAQYFFYLSKEGYFLFVGRPSY